MGQKWGICIGGLGPKGPDWLKKVLFSRIPTLPKKSCLRAWTTDMTSGSTKGEGSPQQKRPPSMCDMKENEQSSQTFGESCSSPSETRFSSFSINRYIFFFPQNKLMVKIPFGYDFTLVRYVG